VDIQTVHLLIALDVISIIVHAVSIAVTLYAMRR
jgi:hypothetical protein